MPDQIEIETGYERALRKSFDLVGGPNDAPPADQTVAAKVTNVGHTSGTDQSRIISFPVLMPLAEADQACWIKLALCE